MALLWLLSVGKGPHHGNWAVQALLLGQLVMHRTQLPGIDAEVALCREQQCISVEQGQATAASRYMHPHYKPGAHGVGPAAQECPNMPLPAVE
jgi:hypothetical protein